MRLPGEGMYRTSTCFKPSVRRRFSVSVAYCHRRRSHLHACPHHLPPDHFKPILWTGDGQKFASKYEQACRHDAARQPFSSNNAMHPPQPPSFNVDTNTVWSLANFCPREAPKAGASSKGNIDCRGNGGVNLKHALPMIRYIFTCKLLSVTCPNWTCECAHWHLAICMSPLLW